MLTQLWTSSRHPKAFPDYQLFYSSKHPMHALSIALDQIEPTCYSKAMSSPTWRVAMGQEFDALLFNRTWSLCPKSIYQWIIRNKWVYKIKRKLDSSMECFKACLVAKGYGQHSGVDFIETFIPVVKSFIIWTILALVVNFNWCIRQLNVSDAFLHSFFDEVVYMEQP